MDLTALEAATHYDDGYHKDSAPVRWFWEVRVCMIIQARSEAQPQNMGNANLALVCDVQRRMTLIGPVKVFLVQSLCCVPMPAGVHVAGGARS